ncbi:ferritin-like domain-containing protein [Halorarum halophilum]|uniref:Ferritin-like domain-containing protein n=1 Tax=Halorarum halophilum TaxID=2743090 RepID=A0A7D5GK04_9EURY|nr:ferritin-like domain-containing protein [Halobaculum halophilum]QLG29351.1 ferritin-like domain-containing protein [Halobaculum halophilum]
MALENRDDEHEQTQRSETDDGRRRFLTGSAGAIGALALGSAFGAQSVLASGDDHGTDTEEQTEDAFEDDVAILNYALTLEYLEAAFYRRALDNLNRNDLLSDRLDELPESVRERIFEQLTVIQEHEEIHVEFLTEVITDLGGEPAEEPEFDFGSAVEEPVEFIRTAAVLEDTGVAAYAGAAPSIEDEDLVPPALSIHSVEARHASFVRELGGQIGFPDAFDEPLPRDAVLEAASQFIVSDSSEEDDGETETATDDDETETETATDDGH